MSGALGAAKPVGKFEWLELLRRVQFGSRPAHIAPTCAICGGQRKASVPELLLGSQTRPASGQLVTAVGLLLTSYADSDGVRIFPGDDRLARELEVSVRSIETGRQTLVAVGMLEVARPAYPAGLRATEWRLTFPINGLVVLPMLPVDRGPRDDPKKLAHLTWCPPSPDIVSGDGPSGNRRHPTMTPSSPDNDAPSPDNEATVTRQDVGPFVMSNHRHSQDISNHSPALATGHAREAVDKPVCAICGKPERVCLQAARKVAEIDRHEFVAIDRPWQPDPLADASGSRPDDLRSRHA